MASCRHGVGWPLALSCALGCKLTLDLPERATDAAPADADTDAFVAGTPASTLGLGVGDTCQLRQGELACWGGSSGLSPLGLGGDWLEIASGELHRCGIRAGRSVWCWGANNEGELGTGDSIARDQPVRVDLDGAWQQLGLSRFSTAAVSTDGALWTWGRNADGELGVPAPARSLSPGRVGTGSSWTQVSTGGNHRCALDSAGGLWCWGNNQAGQVGVDSAQPSVPMPQAIAGAWLDVFCGKEHTCAIAGDGSLWCWGRNVEGQLGLGNRGAGTDRSLPVRVGLAVDWQDIGGSRFASCGIRAGILHCWGDNVRDAVGVPGVDFYVVPTAVDDQRWRAIADSNGEHACAETEAGALWCWGDNREGQLGTGDTTARASPVEVLFFDTP